MTTWKHQIFKGIGEPHDGIANLPPPPNWRVFKDVQTQQTNKGKTFQARPEEIELVNAALLLRRPLLVTGKPGTGKTSLAYAVARELKLGEVLYWPITTRTTLKDGLYSYDAIGRLQDTQQREQAVESSGKVRDIGQYIRLGPLGTALLPSPDPIKPRVVLVDEIDKSDLDLSNDLLHVFEEGSFEIPELVRIKDTENEVTVRTAYKDRTQEPYVKIQAGLVQCMNFPFVILTSNGERDFPPPFLRRCIRLEMREPNKTELARIVQAHLGTEVLEQSVTLIDEFLRQRDSEGKELATDQLLNAICVMLQRELTTQESRDQLLDKLMKPLSGVDA
ncbi:AAA family ATPase [Leptothoe sp. LEGE 181152]|nr:AAA family ATPase [Leptothoe sp. LEGE 181152]